MPTSSTKNPSQRILVTGTASGIGRHLTGELCRRGHRVMAADLKREDLERCAQTDVWPKENLLLEAFDVRDSAAWERALDRLTEAWGGVDVVMNVAGVIRPGWIHELSDDDIDFHLDINFKGVAKGTRAAARRMVEVGSGHIVNIASLASMAPVPGLGLYVASKYAVRGFSMAAAHELKDKGVWVSTVCPDAVQTPMLDLQVDYPEAAMTFTAPRFLTPEDITQTLLKVLARRPVLTSIPKSRAFLARIADLFPTVAGGLNRLLRKRGDRIRQSFELKS